MSSWFVTHRIEWITETVKIFGFINRDHIMRKFGVSVAQASHDLKAAIDWNPDLMRYNVNAKRYELQGGVAVLAGDDDQAMKVVPVEPTDEMIAAGIKQSNSYPVVPPGFVAEPIHQFTLRQCWLAMLQAFTDTNIEKEVR